MEYAFSAFDAQENKKVSVLIRKVLDIEQKLSEEVKQMNECTWINATNSLKPLQPPPIPQTNSCVQGFSQMQSRIDLMQTNYDELAAAHRMLKDEVELLRRDARLEKPPRLRSEDEGKFTVEQLQALMLEEEQSLDTDKLPQLFADAVQSLEGHT